MMKMHKVKPKTDKYMTNGPVGMKSAESKPSYPIVRFQLENLPEAKECKMGDTVTVEVTGKVVSLSQSRFDNSFEVEMREVGMEKGEKKDE